MIVCFSISPDPRMPLESNSIIRPCAPVVSIENAYEGSARKACEFQYTSTVISERISSRERLVRWRSHCGVRFLHSTCDISVSIGSEAARQDDIAA